MKGLNLGGARVSLCIRSTLRSLSTGRVSSRRLNPVRAHPRALAFQVTQGSRRSAAASGRRHPPSGAFTRRRGEEPAVGQADAAARRGRDPSAPGRHTGAEPARLVYSRVWSPPTSFIGCSTFGSATRWAQRLRSSETEGSTWSRLATLWRVSRPHNAPLSCSRMSGETSTSPSSVSAKAT